MSDALVLIGIGLVGLVAALWHAVRPKSTIGSAIRLSPEQEAAFDQEASR